MGAHPMSSLVRTAGLVAGLAVALTACSTAGDGSRSSGEDGTHETGVISRKAAENVLRNYTRVNNAANAKRDTRKIATVEGGSLLEQSKAALTQYHAWPKKQQKSYYSDPFDFQVKGAHFYIPRKGTADVFMVDTRKTSGGGDEKSRHLITFKRDKDGGGADWKAVAIGDLDGKLPKVQRDSDGFATVLTPSTTVGTTKLDDLRGLSEDFYVTGGEKADRRFANTSTVKTWKKDHGNADDFDDNCVDGEYEPASSAARTVYALRTADGGALALYDFALDYKNRSKAKSPQCDSVMRLSDMPEVTQIYLNGRTTTPALTRTNSSIALAVVPPSGKDVRVTGDYVQLINATG